MLSDLVKTDLLPSTRLAFVNPLNMIDTFMYEFNMLAPKGVIASVVGIGLQGFERSAALAALDANLDDSLEELAKRNPQMMFFGGEPILLQLADDYSDRFRDRIRCTYGAIGGTALDAYVAAMRALGAKNVVLANKWGSQLNEHLKGLLVRNGLGYAGAVTQVHEAASVKGSYKQGAQLALSLAERALNEHPDSDCLVLAGGAWLVAPFIPAIEQELGIPVIGGQHVKAWYCLNRVGAFTPREDLGILMNTAIGDAKGDER